MLYRRFLSVIYFIHSSTYASISISQFIPPPLSTLVITRFTLVKLGGGKIWEWKARLLCSWNSPSKNTGVGSHFLLLGIFPAQRSNPLGLHCRQIAGRFFTIWTTRETHRKYSYLEAQEVLSGNCWFWGKLEREVMLLKGTLSMLGLPGKWTGSAAFCATLTKTML